jgi:hypothetical protein
VDIAGAQEVNVETLDDVSASEVLPGRIDVDASKSVHPDPVSVKEMEPKIAAGFTLAKIVLGITVASIVILCLYLAIMEFFVGSDVKAAYTQVILSSRPAAELYVLSNIERMMTDVQSLEKKDNNQLPEDAAANMANVIRLITAAHSIAASDRDLIKGCNTPPLDLSRADYIRRCVAALNRVRESAIEISSLNGSAEIASDFAAKILQQRESLHTFWIQAAQLILLNLLLPLLTALFGYIFGTQQSIATQKNG